MALLLAESALFTLASLLFAADEGGLRRAIAFFFLSIRADLLFSFFLPSFPHQARVLRSTLVRVVNVGARVASISNCRRSRLQRQSKPCLNTGALSFATRSPSLRLCQAATEA